MDAATIVQRIRALGGITRKELAGLAKISPSTVGRIESGALDPTWGTLTRILVSTGYRITGDSIVSAGDATAIAAARPVLEPFLTSSGKPVVAAPADAAIGDWVARWSRAGWVSDKTGADDVVTLAISAGNAAKLARRSVPRRYVAADEGWSTLPRRLSDAGIEYAVSGLVATRDDRSRAAAANPVVYVPDPADAVARLGLEERTPGQGVLLIAPTGGEFDGVEVEDGIRFVSRAQAILDAFAGFGREPDKAENTLRRMLAVSA